MGDRIPRTTRILARVCAVCPACFLKRRFPTSAYARFMARLERACPFCRAYGRVKGAGGGCPAPPPSRRGR